MIHFYCFSSSKILLVSDLPSDKIKAKYGHRYEILTSVKDKESVDLIKVRILRSYPGYIIEEVYQKSKHVFTDEQKKKISESKIGKPRDALTRAKISAKLKGRSNFQGKTHNIETKEVMREKKLGNQHTKGYVWAHDPRSDTEVRVKTRADIPKGFSKGRDYYSTEPGLYFFKVRDPE